MKDTIPYQHLVIWLQPVNEFGADLCEPVRTINDALLHAHAGDCIQNPCYVADLLACHLDGEWIVKQRVFREHRSSPYGTPRNLTLYLSKP